MQLVESSIYVSLKQLRKLLYQAQFVMTKADRIIYGTPLMKECGEALACFVLAFTCKEKRLQYLESCIGHFSVLRTDLEMCVEQNIIKYPKVEKEGETKVNPRKVELFTIVGKIDADACKWYASITKGKTIAE